MSEKMSNTAPTKRTVLRVITVQHSPDAVTQSKENLDCRLIIAMLQFWFCKSDVAKRGAEWDSNRACYVEASCGDLLPLMGLESSGIAILKVHDALMRLYRSEQVTDIARQQPDNKYYITSHAHFLIGLVTTETEDNQGISVVTGFSVKYHPSITMYEAVAQ